MNARGTYAAATKAFRRLTQLEPRAAVHWMNLATSLRASGALSEAAQAYEHAARIGGWTAELLYNSALLELEGGRYEVARERLGLAAKAAPLDFEINYRYAHLLTSCADIDGALLATQHWRLWQDPNPELLAKLGALLMTLSDQHSAVQILDSVRNSPPPSLEFELSIISMLERTNSLHEATERLQKIEHLSVDEIGAEMQQRLLGVRANIAARNDRPDEAITLYRQALCVATQPDEQQDFLFPLAKALDAKGDYETAAEVAARAHASQMAFLDLTSPIPADSSGTVLAIADYSCDPDDVAQWTEPAPPVEADSPVFIVAFPRSGTTLLEQVLDAHPDLKTMDEQPFLQEALARLQQQGALYPEKLASVQPHELAEARRHYWALVATKLRLSPGQRLLDKNPLNILRLPAIRRLFPNSPILLAIRHPFDVITSNYFQHYWAPAYSRLCRDLPTLALGYRRTFDYWYQQEALLKPKVMEIFYERFVSDFEAQSRAIADFVGLQWHDAMLEPAKHARGKSYISTPSYSQVIEPVNRKAVGRWRHYERHLMPLREQIAPLLDRWGYEA
ncbi:tetratricopeptide repeat-containing sulfotransferase family protein [Hydrocarboniphaga sp.]|uniref:tetratricopeptide repeat-containing sulfotransferase family protein n=1 Tax=Hydrocarboniphaga sp. TaxID=2033016 RepID=UPI002617E62D|nr:tetratricopeptide repeat-containing sulfotransferase family protein [Hydrocarboniphaga sp.]